MLRQYMALDFAIMMTEDHLIDVLMRGDEAENLPACYREQQIEYAKNEWLEEDNPIESIIVKHMNMFGDDALSFICTIRKDCEFSLSVILGYVIVGYCASANNDMLRVAISAWKMISGERLLRSGITIRALSEICATSNKRAANIIIENSYLSCFGEHHCFELLFILCGNGCTSIAQQIVNLILFNKHARSEIDWQTLIKTARDHNLPSFVAFLEKQAIGDGCGSI